MKKLIFFDVDGVLVESSREIMLTSWNEYNQWLADQGLPSAPFTTHYHDIPEPFLESRTEYMTKSHKGYYRVAINLFTLAGFDPSQVSKELIQQVSEADSVLMEKTMSRLKTVRDRLLNEGDLSQLARCYGDVDYAWIEQKMGAGELYLITNNAFSIKSLAAVSFTPHDEYVRGPHGTHHNKANHINEICQQHGVDQQRVMFIDDSLASLQDVQQGTKIPVGNIVQNSWAEKRPVSEYPRLTWSGIIDQYQDL